MVTFKVNLKIIHIIVYLKDGVTRQEGERENAPSAGSLSQMITTARARPSPNNTGNKDTGIPGG